MYGLLRPCKILRITVCHHCPHIALSIECTSLFALRLATLSEQGKKSTCFKKLKQVLLIPYSTIF